MDLTPEQYERAVEVVKKCSGRSVTYTASMISNTIGITYYQSLSFLANLSLAERE